MVKKSSGKLNIAFCYDDSLDGQDGVAQYVKTIGAWLSAQGHNVLYLVGETKLKAWHGAPIYSLASNQVVNFNGNQVGTPWPASKKSIESVLAKHQIDVLHVQMPYSPFFAGRAINLVGPKTAVVGTFHILPVNILVRWGSKLLSLFYLRTLKRFSRIVSVSQPAAQFAGVAFGIKSDVLPNMVQLEKFKSASGQQKKYHIVFLGRLVPRKGAEQLLRAFIILKTRLPEASLSIAGDGPERAKLEAIVKNNGLSSSVNFLGFVDEKDKPNIMASASVACFPSLGGESFGIVLIEAMAAGAGVVIGGNNPGYASVLGEKSRALVDPRDSTVFAARLETFLTDQNLAQRLHREQQEQVKQYDVAIVGNHLLQIYMEAIASRHQKP